MSQVEFTDQVSHSGSQRAGLSWPSPNVAAAINAFVDRGPFGVAVFDTDLRFLLVSQGLATLHGQEASETVGKRIDEVLPDPYGELVARPLREALNSGVPILDVETWGTFADPSAERSFTSSFYRLADSSGTPLGVVVLITETTELRYAESAARSAAQQLELLQQVTEVLSGSASVADVTQVALDGAATAVGAASAMLMALDAKDNSLAHLASTGLMDDTMTRFREPALLDASMPHCDAVRSRAITLWESRLRARCRVPRAGRLFRREPGLGLRPSAHQGQSLGRGDIRLAPRPSLSRDRRLAPGRRREAVRPGSRTVPDPRGGT